MFYPDFTNGYKSRIFQYAPRILFTLIFVFLEIFILSFILIVSENIGEANNLKLGISIFLIALVILSILSLNIYQEDIKNILIHLNQSSGKLIQPAGMFLILIIILSIHSLFYGNSDLFMLINMFLALFYYIISLIFIYKFGARLDENDKKINENTSVINVLTAASTEKLLQLKELTSIRLFVSLETKKIFIDVISIDKKQKQTVEFNFKKKSINLENLDLKIELSISENGDYRVIKFKSVDLPYLLQVTNNQEQGNLKYYWFIDINDPTNENRNINTKVDIYLSEINLDSQNSILNPNRYIFLSNDFKKKINVYDSVPVIFLNNVPIRYIIEIENFRFQDLDEDRKISVSRLIEEAFFENNEYNGSIIKTHLVHKHALDLTNNRDKFFKSNHVFIMLEEIETNKINPNFVTRFLKRFKEIQNEFSGFNLKLNIMDKSQSIEILHNIFSKENIHNIISKKINEYEYRDISSIEKFVQMEEMIKKENEFISEDIYFDLKKSTKNYTTIKKKDPTSKEEKIMFSHADTLPVEDAIGLFTRLFSRDIDETIKITYQRYKQNSGKNKVNKHLSRSNKYFKKLYPDKKMYKIKYTNESDNIRSALIRMYEGQVYQLSFDVIKKLNDYEMTKEDYVYINQGIRIKKSHHNHLEQAAFLMKPSQTLLTDRKNYTFLGVYLATGKSLSKLGMFGESIDFNEKGLYVGSNLDVSKQDNYDVPVVVDFSEYTDYSKDYTSSSNGHMVIIGKSGSGKTYLTKSIIHQKYEKSRRQIIVFDIEDDYEPVTKNEEKSRTIDIASFDDGINPFRIIYHQDEISDESTESIKKVFSRHIYFLQNFLKDMFHIKEDEFDSELYALIIKIYENSEMFIEKMTFTKFNNQSSFPTMENLLQAVKTRRKEIISSKKLEDHTKNYEVLNQLYVSIENQLIENLKDAFWYQKFSTDYVGSDWDNFDIIRINLKELIRSSQIIQNYKLGLKLLMQQLEIYIFNRNVPEKPYKLDKNNRLGVFITVDEAHRYFKKELFFMVDFFAAIAKQGRKRVIELCMISQNISDFYRQSDSKDIEQKASDIIKNSGYKFVMQVAQDFDRIYDFIESGYHLSEAEKSRIKSLNRYRVYLIQGPFKRTMIQTHALKSTEAYYGKDL